MLRQQHKPATTNTKYFTTTITHKNKTLSTTPSTMNTTSCRRSRSFIILKSCRRSSQHSKKKFTNTINQQLNQWNFIVGNFEIEIDQEWNNLQLLYRVKITPTIKQWHQWIIIYRKLLPTSNIQTLENTHNQAGKNKGYVRWFNKSDVNNREKSIKTIPNRWMLEEICKFIK